MVETFPTGVASTPVRAASGIGAADGRGPPNPAGGGAVEAFPFGARPSLRGTPSGTRTLDTLIKSQVL